MAKRKRTTKKPRARTRTRTVTKVRYRNPPKKRRAPARAKRGIEGLDLAKAMRGSMALAFGMLCAKAAVNKVTQGGSETERWSWPNIATAAITGFLVSFAAGSLFNMKRETTSLIFMGGLTLAMYKAFTTKLAPQWGWAESWFGADDIHPAFAGYGADDIHPDFLGSSDEMYQLTDGGTMEPSEAETAEMMGEIGLAGELVPFNPAMGDDYEDMAGELVPFNPAMGASDLSPYPSSVTTQASNLAQKSRKAYPGSY